MEILVFRTDLQNRKSVHAVTPHLERIEGIMRWNVDLQDVDKVLRVESVSASAQTIAQSLNSAGYYCEEL